MSVVPFATRANQRDEYFRSVLDQQVREFLVRVFGGHVSLQWRHGKSSLLFDIFPTLLRQWNALRLFNPAPKGSFMKPHSTPYPDYFGILNQLSDEHRLVMDSTRKFIVDHAEPLIQSAYREETFLKELVSGMGELGIFGSNLSGYGLAGLDNIAYGLRIKGCDRNTKALTHRRD